MSKQKVAIIGAGYSGLSSACYLAKWGYEVTVYEKYEAVGGRARSFSENGFVFDMGPSWYWMPDVFERFFGDFGKKVSDYYQLTRLSPGYRVYFKNSSIDVPASENELMQLFEQKEAGSSANLKRFLKEAEYKYNVGIHNLVYKPGIHLNEFFDKQLISGLFKLDVFKSMSKHIRSLFKNEELIQLLEFPVLFLGALPQNTPALYSLMNYADLVKGTWYPMGGMQKIAEGMQQLALELGVKFETGFDATQIHVDGNWAKTLSSKNKHVNFDAIVSSADYHFTEQKLLQAQYRNYSEKYWESRKMAPSCLIFYMGLNTRLPNVLHHNLFFDEPFDKHAQEIYSQPAWPNEPLFYLCCPSKTDASVAPEGYENLFALIPVAPGLEDTPDLRDKYFKILTKRILSKTGVDITQHLVYQRSYAPSNFIEDYNAFKGNAYGLANTLMQTAHLKPGLRNKNVKNLIYTGQLTVPGPGVPPSLISGKLAAEQVLNLFKG